MKFFIYLTLILFYSEVYSQTRIKANRILNFDYQTYFKEEDTANHDLNSLVLTPITEDSIFKEKITYHVLKNKMSKRQFAKFLTKNQKSFEGVYFFHEKLSSGMVNGLYFQDFKLVSMPEIDGLFSTYLFHRYLYQQSFKGKNEVRFLEYRLTVPNKFFPRLSRNTISKEYINFIKKVNEYFNDKVVLINNGF